MKDRDRRAMGGMHSRHERALLDGPDTVQVTMPDGAIRHVTNWPSDAHRELIAAGYAAAEWYAVGIAQGECRTAGFHVSMLRHPDPLSDRIVVRWHTPGHAIHGSGLSTHVVGGERIDDLPVR